MSRDGCTRCGHHAESHVRTTTPLGVWLVCWHPGCECLIRFK